MIQAAEESMHWPTLIDKARAGCDEALGKILTEVRDYLVLVARSELSGRVQAKFAASDIVQGSLIDAQASIGDFVGTSEGEFRKWVKQIVIHNLTDEVRRYTQTQARNVERERPIEGFPSFPHHSHTETPSWNVHQNEVDEQLAKAVAQLPREQRYFVEAKYRHGHSNLQIAQQLQISESEVRRVWAKAARRLRRLLEQSA